MLLLKVLELIGKQSQPVYCIFYNIINISAAAKKPNVKAAPSKTEKVKPVEKKWTEEDEAAKKIQTTIRGFLGRRKLLHLKNKKQEYEDLMDKLERDVSYANIIVMELLHTTI